MKYEPGATDPIILVWLLWPSGWEYSPGRLQSGKRLSIATTVVFLKTTPIQVTTTKLLLALPGFGPFAMNSIKVSPYKDIDLKILFTLFVSCFSATSCICFWREYGRCSVPYCMAFGRDSSPLCEPFWLKNSWSHCRGVTWSLNTCKTV